MEKKYSVAICFKSDSTDYYMFTSGADTLEEVLKDLSLTWFVETEYIDIMALSSDTFDHSELKEGVSSIINQM